MNFPSRETVERVRREYPAGTLVELVKMDDAFAPPVGTVGEVLAECIENGVLCLSAKEKLRLLPPLNIEWEQLGKAIDVIIKALKNHA